jgi:hypothetical protein
MEQQGPQRGESRGARPGRRGSWLEGRPGRSGGPGLPGLRGLCAIDGRVRLMGALLALVSGFDVLILPAALSPTAPLEAARLAELAWCALWLVFGLAVLRCATWRPGRALAPSRVREPLRPYR